MSVSIHWHSERRAEILWLYDESVFHRGIGHESKAVSTRYRETHALSLGPEDAPPVVLWGLLTPLSVQHAETLGNLEQGNPLI
jgi:hypothetical protein